MKRLSTFFVLGTLFSSLLAVLEVVPDQFYKAKISERDIYLIMERVSDSNYAQWLAYAVQQSSDRLANDGNLHFKNALNQASYRENEVWVAYATTHVEQEYNALKSDKMLIFMSVISSPKALVTTHMGISKTEEAQRNPVNSRGLSMYLHSFAAKVMLQRNPSRQFMVTVPAYTMTRIMNKHLPKEAIFIGTKEQEQNILERKHITLRIT